MFYNTRTVQAMLILKLLPDKTGLRAYAAGNIFCAQGRRQNRMKASSLAAQMTIEQTYMHVTVRGQQALVGGLEGGLGGVQGPRGWGRVGRWVISSVHGWGQKET